MASDRAKLQVAARDERGTRANRRLRRDGFVPGVVYGRGDEAQAFKVGERDLRTVLLQGHALLDLEVEGHKTVPVVIKEQQLHPVRGSVSHIDFQEVRLDVKITSPVPIELEGTEEAPGVKEGGVLEHVTREVTVEALPTDIPDRIVVGVSHMDINDTLTLSELTAPPGAEFTDDPETTIATLSPPRVEEEPEPEVEEEAELVGEDGEPIEGEAPADGAEAPAEESAEGE